MQPFPHHYSVSASAATQGDVAIQGDMLPTIASAPPTEFGGPGDRWSPETLLVAAVADCFVLTFRGIAGLSRLPWNSLECNVTGKVDRVDRSRNSPSSASTHASESRSARTRIKRGASLRRLRRPVL